jgi:DNA-binding NtrC family response regulator
MSVGKRLLMFTPQDPKASSLVARTADWGCLASTCETIDELRGRFEGGQYDYVLVEDSTVLRKLAAESDPTGEILRTPLAEIEKRHILRVLSSTGGNKTRAAKILGIDTKTLYNKLKSYETSAALARRRLQNAASGGGAAAAVGG